MSRATRWRGQSPLNRLISRFEGYCNTVIIDLSSMDEEMQNLWNRKRDRRILLSWSDARREAEPLQAVLQTKSRHKSFGELRALQRIRQATGAAASSTQGQSTMCSTARSFAISNSLARAQSREASCACDFGQCSAIGPYQKSSLRNMRQEKSRSTPRRLRFSAEGALAMSKAPCRATSTLQGLIS